MDKFKKLITADGREVYKPAQYVDDLVAAQEAEKKKEKALRGDPMGRLGFKKAEEGEFEAVTETVGRQVVTTYKAVGGTTDTNSEIKEEKKSAKAASDSALASAQDSGTASKTNAPNADTLASSKAAAMPDQKPGQKQQGE